MRNVLVDFFKNEDIKRDVKDVIKPVVSFIYDEIYVYIWLICLYNVFFILVVLAILYLLIQLPNKVQIHHVANLDLD